MSASGAATRRAGGSARRGVVLLEVVLALGLMLVAVAMVGVAFSNSDRNATKSVEKARAVMLTEHLVTRFDTGEFQDQREVTGAFGDEGPPGWAWSLTLDKDPTVQGMERLTIRVVLGDPDGSPDEQQNILTTYMLRAEKKNFNLMDDFGMSEDQVQQLTDAIPGGQAVLDPTNFDPASFAKLDMATLQEMLPILMQSMASAGAGVGGIPGGMGVSNLQGMLGGATGGGNRGGAGQQQQGGGQNGGGQTGGGQTGAGLGGNTGGSNSGDQTGGGQGSGTGRQQPFGRRNAFSNPNSGGQ